MASWFYGTGEKVEQVVFDDGTVWGTENLRARANVPTSGDDFIEGTPGSDLLDGGAGNDWLNGGAGSDTFHFGISSGSDTISGSDDSEGKSDVVELGAGILPGDVLVRKGLNGQGNLSLFFKTDGDQLLIEDFFGYGGGYGGKVGTVIDEVKFSDGTVWDAALLKSLAQTIGTDQDDYLYGSTGNDTLLTMGGNDVLDGGAGDDTLDGGIGNDYLYGGYGNDTYVFGNGYGQDAISDYDWSGSNFDTVKMTDGVRPEDVTVTSDAYHTYLSLNGGSDTLALQYSNWGDGNKIERVEFADGTVWDGGMMSQATVVSAGNDVLVGTASDDNIDGLSGDDQVWGEGGNDALFGGTGNDTLHGGTGSDTLDGGAGNDNLQGDAGNDVYLFGLGSGQDAIIDYDTALNNVDTVQMGTDVLPDSVLLTRDRDNLYMSINGGADKLTLANWFVSDAYKVERVSFVDGTVWDTSILMDKMSANENDNELWGSAGNDILDGMSGNDTIFGLEGDDTLIGSSGDDRLDGGPGNDTYLFGIGDGQDTISSYDWSQGKQDVVKFKAGISAADVGVSQQKENLVLSIAGTSDQLTIQDYFSNDGSFNPYGIELIQFSDGNPAWQYEDVWAKVLQGSEGGDTIVGSIRGDVINGLGGNDQIFGRAGDDLLDGGSGNDQLCGDGGNDTLDGGSGNDDMQGDTGNDTYLFGPSSGQDTIYDYDASAGNIDTVRLADDVLPTDVRATRDADNLYLSFNSGADQLELTQWFVDDAYKIERVTFADGTVWGVTELQSFANAINDGNNYILGTAGDDTLNGLGGDDEIFGQSGNDTLNGGAGNDILQGGDGNDSYLFGSGFGQDTIYDYDPSISNIDTVRMVEGTLPAEVDVSRNQNNLYLSLNNGIDRLTLSNWFVGDEYKVERVVFDDGTVWDTTELQELVSIVSNEGDNYLEGSVGDDVLGGLGGNDCILGQGGNDTLDGGNGNDSLYGGAGDNVLNGGAGNDILESEDGNDLLDGGDGDDYLYGGAGDDVLDGGTGSDELEDEDGNDVFVFGRGYGKDVVYSWDQDKSFTDVVRFRSDVLPSDIVVQRAEVDGNESLVLSIRNSIDTLTIYGFFDPTDGPSQQIDAVEFTNGTRWTTEQLIAMTLNSPPLVAVPLADQAASEDTAFGFTVPANTFTDVNAGDKLAFSASLANGSALPSWLTFDAATRSFSGTPANGDVGNLNLKVTATDLAGASVSSSFELSVANTNDAPVVANAIAAQVANEDTVFSFVIPTDTFADIDVGDSLALSATQADGSVLPSWLTFDAATRSFSGTPSNGDVGSLNLKVTATDLVGASVSSIFTVAVANTNDAPAEANIIGAQAATEAETFSFVVPAAAFTDIDVGDTLVLSATLANGDPLPPWLTFDAATRGFSGTPAFGDVGNFSLRITATDVAGASASQNFALTVNAVTGIALTGTAGNDVLTGTALNDTLDGGVGLDQMLGGAGNDTYYVDNVGDTVVEQAGGGVDTVVSSVSLTLAANVEKLILSGTTKLNGTGNGLNNVLTGNRGANTLNGGVGADTLVGGLGNDIYVVDNIGDVVIEASGEGTDLVQSSVTYTLFDNVENLTLTGTAAINGTGNASNNRLNGNDAANVFSVGAGNDTVWGHGGDDLIYGGDDNDVLGGDAGDDTVWGDSGNDLLDGDVGNDVLHGGAGVDTLCGGDGNDLLYGEAGNDKLWGGLGNDISWGGDGVDQLGGDDGNDVLYGEAGNDLLYGGSGNDFVDGGSGNDYIEGEANNDIMAGGDGDDSLYDFQGNNVFFGGAGSDYLNGTAGNNMMIGCAGKDTLVTGSGNDVTLFNKGDGQDIFASEGAGNDTLSLGGDFSYSDLSFTKTGNDLVLKEGASDQITFKDWYAATPSKPVVNLQVIAEAMAGFEAGGADPLLDQKVEQFNFTALVAAFDAARAANATLTSWTLSNALATCQLTGSDTAALGGDLAYQYGKNGTLAGIGLTAAQAVINDSNFGTQAQTINPLAGLQTGTVRLT